MDELRDGSSNIGRDDGFILQLRVATGGRLGSGQQCVTHDGKSLLSSALRMRQRSSCDVDSANNLPLLTHSDGKVYRVDSAFKHWDSPKCCMLVADASWNFHFTTTDGTVRDGTGRRP